MLVSLCILIMHCLNFWKAMEGWKEPILENFEDCQLENSYTRFQQVATIS